MTISEYLKGLEKLPHRNPTTGKTLLETMKETTHIWDNDACMGYCIKALEAAGLDEDQKKAVLRALEVAFYDFTIDQAHEAGKTAF